MQIGEFLARVTGFRNVRTGDACEWTRRGYHSNNLWAKPDDYLFVHCLDDEFDEALIYDLQYETEKYIQYRTR